MKLCRILALSFVAALFALPLHAQTPDPSATRVQQVQPLVVCDQSFTQTGAANGTVTATTGTPPGGTVFYVCTIDINEIANAAVTGAAGPAEVCATTNLPNNMTWWGSNATMTAGQLTPVITLSWGAYPLKSTTGGTAFTIACTGGQSTYNVRVNMTGFFARP